MKVKTDDYEVNVGEEIEEMAEHMRKYINSQIIKLSERYKRETDCDDNKGITLDMANGYMDISLKPLLINLMFYINKHVKNITNERGHYLMLKEHIVDEVINHIRQTNDSLNESYEHKCENKDSKISKEDILKKIRELVKESGLDATVISI